MLKAAGCTFDDVDEVTTFHTDPATQWKTAAAVRSKNIGDPHYPNWTAVGVNWLAGFDFRDLDQRAPKRHRQASRLLCKMS